jgi:hypothetical protein
VHTWNKRNNLVLENKTDYQQNGETVPMHNTTTSLQARNGVFGNAGAREKSTLTLLRALLAIGRVLAEAVPAAVLHNAGDALSEAGGTEGGETVGVLNASGAAAGHADATCGAVLN